MKRWKKVLFWILGSVFLLVTAVFAMLFYSMGPTTGPRIGAYPSPRTALLIIDIQEDFTGPQPRKRYKDGDRIVAASNALLAQAQSKGVVVVYVKNVIENPFISILTNGMNAPDAPGTEMDRRITKVLGARTFAKTRSDAFSNQELDAYLRQNQVEQLLLTGLDGAYCVNATTRGGLNRGYKVTLFPEAIATESGTSIDQLTRDWMKAGAQVKTELKL